MDFRDYATTEASAVVERLLASHSEASLRSVRDALAAAVRAVDAATEARPDIAGPVLDLVTRLGDTADATTQRIRTEFDKDLAAIRGQADTLREELETESARAATLEADLDAVIEAHRQVDAERVQAEAAREHEAKARAAAQEELTVARDLLDAARTEVSHLRDTVESETATRALIEAELASAKSTIVSLEEQLHARDTAARNLESRLEQEIAATVAQRSSMDAELEAASDRAATLEERIRTRDEAIRDLEARLLESQTREATLRSQAVEASDLANTLRAERDAAVRRAEEARKRADAAEPGARRPTAAGSPAPAPAVVAADAAAAALGASVRTLDELNAAETVSDLLSTATQQLATRFDRVALFRIKGHHLEGEHVAGVDAPVNVTKLSIPMGLDSIITRAASRGSVEHLSGTELGDQVSPFGGEPHSAIALPIQFQGETFAVAYADHSEPLSDAARAFATLVAKQTGILLSRLTQELKALKELRDYAALLLQEAEQMFLADFESARPEHERQQRLRETIECARQLFAQRAALEGSTAARLLDEQIAAAISEGSSPAFARDLAAAFTASDVQRTAS